MDKLVEGLKSVADEFRIKILHFKNVLELGNHAIKDSYRDLHGVNLATHGILQVGVSHFETLMHDVMLV